ncbi:MAG TPA: FAD-dependent oxidoreductase [Candidatus Babeliales bacterium]|nr:FAD-dependent oxidoreductase [Candidatus Babeliales bacterium]
MNKTHIIIGASAAGIGVLNKLSQLVPDDTIICISAEKEAPYNTCLLADYGVGEKTVQELSIFNSDRLRSNHSLLLGVRVVAIDKDAKIVACSDGQTFQYDTLFIGMGTAATKPNIDGIDAAGVFTFHTMADCQTIASYIKQQPVKRAVVVGAGLTGLEVADMLHAHNVSVAVVEKQPRVLASLISPEGSHVIEDAMMHSNIPFYANDMVLQIVHDNGVVTGVQLASGAFIFADVVVVAVGATPNTALAQQAGIAVSQYGIITDEYLMTNVSGIWAGGDNAQVRCKFTNAYVQSCTWPDAMQQGLIAAQAMAGVPKVYPGATRITDSSFFGIEFQAGGVPYSANSEHEIITEPRDGGAYSIILENNKPVGFFGIGSHAISREYKKRLLMG